MNTGEEADPFAAWENGPDDPQLAENEIHVWGWSLAGRDAGLAQTQALLSADELERMRAFRFASDAERYARSRGGLRQILGRYMRVDPADLRFTYGEHGKPSLLALQRGIHFNLSHTPRIAVAAFTAAGSVGIDVEERHPVSRTLGEEVFSELELRELDCISNEEYTAAFFNGWTRKEAVCKAEGLGFHLAAQTFSVSLLSGQPARINDAGGVLSRDWFLSELPLGGTATGCVAVAVPSILRLYRVAAGTSY